MFDFCPAHSAQYQAVCASCCKKLCIGCHPVEINGRNFCTDCLELGRHVEVPDKNPVTEKAVENLERFYLWLGLFILALILAAGFTALSGMFAGSFLNSLFLVFAILSVGAGLACWVTAASAMRDHHRILVCPHCRKSLYSYNPLHYISGPLKRPVWRMRYCFRCGYDLKGEKND